MVAGYHKHGFCYGGGVADEEDVVPGLPAYVCMVSCEEHHIEGHGVGVEDAVDEAVERRHVQLDAHVYVSQL